MITSQRVPTKLVIQEVAGEIHHTSGKRSLRLIYIDMTKHTYI